MYMNVAEQKVQHQSTSKSVLMCFYVSHCNLLFYFHLCTFKASSRKDYHLSRLCPHESPSLRERPWNTTTNHQPHPVFSALFRYCFCLVNCMFSPSQTGFWRPVGISVLWSAYVVLLSCDLPSVNCHLILYTPSTVLQIRLPQHSLKAVRPPRTLRPPTPSLYTSH